MIDKHQFKPLAAIVVLVLLFFVGLWMPTRSEQSRLRESIDRKRKEIEIINTSLPDLSALARKVHQLEDISSDESKQLPRDVQLAAMLSELNSQIEALNVDNANIEQYEPVKGTDYDVTPIKVRFRGTFDATFQFIQQIEMMPRLVRFTRLDMKASSESSVSQRILNVAIDLDTFCAASEGGTR